MEFDATFLVAIVSFVVFVFIMNAIFYAPIMRIMEERNKLVEDNFNKANELNEQTKHLEQYHHQELETSRDEARNALDKEMQHIKSEKSKILSEYKTRLFENVQNDKENLVNSALAAKEILKDNVVDIAKSISGIILGENINAQNINKSQIKIKEEQV